MFEKVGMSIMSSHVEKEYSKLLFNIIKGRSVIYLVRSLLTLSLFLSFFCVCVWGGVFRLYGILQIFESPFSLMGI